MKEDIFSHYHNVQDQAKQRLQRFKDKPETDEALFEELTFCVFAANSSAEMGLKAVNLLKPVLYTGDETTYKDRVDGKVRFYNVRSEYTAHNHNVITNLDKPLRERIQEHDEPRKLIEDYFKGIGWKESSHFLRNTGHTGYCILDKHVRGIMADLDVLNDDDYPNTLSAYEEKERRIHEFCANHDLNVDVLDLALWSYKTGQILK
jgi:N-glycosylase/DNA lyase